MDTAIPPRWVLPSTDREPAISAITGGRPHRGELGPVAGDETAVPPEHRVGFHDQEHLAEPPTVERPRQDREDRPVRLGEPRPVDLALQDQDLMAQGQDLGVALVARREQPADPGHHQPEQTTGEEHQPTVGPDPRNPTKPRSDEFLASSGPAPLLGRSRTEGLAVRCLVHPLTA